MLSLLRTFICQSKRGLLAAFFVLAVLLRSATAHAQAGPISGLQVQQPAESAFPTHHITLDGPYPKGPLSVIYVDGQRQDSTVLARLNPDDIASIDVLKAAIARQLGPKEAQLGVLSITTKAGQHKRAVRVFRKRLEKLRLATPSASPAAN